MTREERVEEYFEAPISRKIELYQEIKQEVLDTISNFGNGNTEFYTGDIEILARHEEFCPVKVVESIH